MEKLIRLTLQNFSHVLKTSSTHLLIFSMEIPLSHCYDALKLSIKFL